MAILNPSLRFPVVLFDLGSTLIYFSGDWPEVSQQGQATLVQTLLQGGLKLDSGAFRTQLQASLDEYFSSRDSEMIEHTTGAILRSLLSRWGYADLPESLLSSALQAMYQISEAYWHVETESQAALEDLRRQGYRLGLISNAADDANVQRLVHKAALRPYFDVILTSAAQGIRKPHPRIFYTALETWQAVPSQAVMVGDTLSADIQGANNLGIYSVWVTRRAAPPDNPAPSLCPDAIIENIGELPVLLSSLA
jgi:HAD superfamily hydrolase (TIGR01662 family)